jgi:hypothetical protein
MAIEFMDGFDYYTGTDATGHQSVWDSASSVTSISADGGGVYDYGRTAALSSNTFLKKTVNSTATKIVAFHMKAAGYNGGNFVSFYDSATLHVNIKVNADKTVTFYRNTTALGTSTALVAAINTWAWYSVKVTIDDAAGVVSLYMNGNLIYELTSQDTRNAGNASCNFIQLSSCYTTASTTNYDNVHIMDSTGATYNNHIGEHRIYKYLGTADGALTDMTASAGNDYACIDENPNNGDTDYISTSTAGHINTVAAPALSLSTIAAVKVSASIRKDDAGTRTARVINRQSTTNYAGTSYDAASTYSFISHLWLVNPATTSAWSGAEVDATQPGIECVA